MAHSDETVQELIDALVALCLARLQADGRQLHVLNAIRQCEITVKRAAVEAGYSY
jgi:hypothetical protein